MGGTFLSAIIPMLTAPVIARIYAPEFYGILGLYMSISNLIGVLAYSHYPQAVMVVKEEKEAKQIIWFSFFFSSGVAIFSGVVIIILLNFTGVFSTTKESSWMVLLPLSVIFNGITASLNNWANRTKSYTNLAFNRIFQALLTVCVQISFGLLYKDGRGLMIGFLVGQFISAVLLLYTFIIKDKKHSIGRPSFQNFKPIAMKHKKWVIYLTPTDFINSFINQSPVFLLQVLAGPSYVGSFLFTQRFLSLPQQYLSNGIVDIFKQKASEAYNRDGNCKILFLKTLKLLSSIAIIPFLVSVFFGPQIFTLAFGSKWTQAGIFAQYLSILFFFRFIISPLSYVYFIVGRLKEDFLLHILFLIATTASFYVTGLFTDNKNMLILAYSISYSAIYIIFFFRSYKFSLNKQYAKL